jgi:hypothetical protein
VQRNDLPDAMASECDAPPTDAVQVSEAAQDLDPTIVTTMYVGPQTIYVGDDQQNQWDIVFGGVDFDTLVTYETVLTQYFQATAAGVACEVLAAARFTG